MRVLVDTNVWLDVITQRQPFFQYSMASILACINDEATIYVVATSLKDIFYLVSRNLDATRAYEALDMMLSLAKIASVDKIVCTKALSLERPDYEDGLIAAAAMTEHIDCIVTRDAKAFRTTDIPKLTPKGFLDAQGYEETDL